MHAVLCSADFGAFDQLQNMEIFFEEENRKGRACVDLYELVQHAGNIVPRL